MSSSRILRVYIHQGHSTVDSGVVAAGGYTEAEFTKRVGEMLAQHLEAAGLLVYTSRDRLPKARSAEVAADANRCRVDVVVSIHANGNGPKAHGGEAFITGLSAVARRMADDFACRFERSFPFRAWRGVKLDTESAVGRLAILRDTRAPAFLVEPGFLSNAGDLDWLRSLAGQVWIAEALKGAVYDQLGQ